MPSHFDLILTADSEARKADLRLLDAHGNQLAYHQVDLGSIPVSRQQGLFNLRDYLHLYVGKGDEERSLAEIGVCLAEQVLGEEIFRHLWQTEAQRTLRLQLPGAAEEGRDLASAFARVPWELARPDLEEPTLGERNLLVRVVSGEAPASREPLVLGAEESLRILFVFAEARGSTPLASRKERRELLRFFEQEVYPKRSVVAHFLTHGVTRERLRSQVQENGGYPILHWSGHGNQNRLELARPNGTPDSLSGEELLALLTKGGLPLPRLVFLSACHSGEVAAIRSWEDFLDRARGKEPQSREAASAPTRKIDLSVQPGYTGTAHALLRGGVPSVVAMRFAVGDEYARDLAVELYRALLAHPQPKSVASALTLARQELLRSGGAGRYDPCDPATPVLYGAEDAGLPLPKGRSPASQTRNRRLPPVTELSTASHEHFVGRTWELAGLGAKFIGSRAGEEVRPVALITGLGGMGKTALVAEALALWEERFEWVLLFQAKPNALPFEGTLRDIHLRLLEELGVYHDHLKAHPADAIYREASPDFTGTERLERLTSKLIRALRDEPILLVLDNFETHLKRDPEPAADPADSEPLWACQDPAWDRCLATLAAELAGSPSRVLVTCRRPLVALAARVCLPVRLGPLPAAEAAVYLREHPALRAMLFGTDEAERSLALRLLAASRFHPLLMDCLARLAAGGASLRPRLVEALDTLESQQGFEGLPALFATRPGDAQELAYLEDALAASLDQLIDSAGREARRLLWTIAVANEPVALGLLRKVWKGEEVGEQGQLRQIQGLLEKLDQQPPELQEKLRGMPPELRAKVEALPPLPDRPDPAPLLRSLLAVGLATEERTGPEDENPDLACHELVRERIRTWMDLHPEERADLPENGLRLAYSDRLLRDFQVHFLHNMAKAQESGHRALVYCIQAGDHARLVKFASLLVTSCRSPSTLARLLPHLEIAADAAPEGRLRWLCLSFIGEALQLGGQPDMSLLFYEHAVTLARLAVGDQGEIEHQAGEDVAAITGNWASALHSAGRCTEAYNLLLESAEAYKNAGSPAVNALSRELEALRIWIRIGKAVNALPQIEARLTQVETWWRRSKAGSLVGEAPNPEFLVRTLLAALNIAAEADRALENPESSLHRTERILEVQKALGRRPEELAATRLNRGVYLTLLRRFSEAQIELESCLRDLDDDPVRKAMTIGALANVFAGQGDNEQAQVQARRALSLFQQLPDPDERAISHNRLATYLYQSATPSSIIEAHRHHLASVVYFLVTKAIQNLRTSERNYAHDFRQARATGTAFAPPRVADLLADPAFHPLDQWLRGRGVDLTELQTAVDKALEQIHQAVLAEPEPPGDPAP